MTHLFNGRIDHLERRKNSVSGNPRFDVAFANGQVFPTKPDAAVNYEIENLEHQHVPVTVTLENGFITYATPAEKE